MTRASVVIPSRGGAQRLPRLLAALAAQTHPDTEVVVVLDGDVDGSAAVLEPWSDRLDLRVVTFPENRGRSAALNAGFVAATGGVLIRCDDDLEPDRNYVRNHVACHEGQTPLGAVGLYLNVYPDNPYTRVYARQRDAIFRQDAYRTTSDMTWRYWAGNVSTTSELWRRVGPYDTAYRAYGFEDVDWGFRLHALGVPIRILPSLETVHHSPATSTLIRARRALHSGAARRTFERLHGGEALGSDRVQGLWGRATDRVGRRLSRRGVDRLARLADWAADPLPQPLAEKLIAFTVESAAAAGRHQPAELDLSI